MDHLDELPGLPTTINEDEESTEDTSDRHPVEGIPFCLLLSRNIYINLKCKLKIISALT